MLARRAQMLTEPTLYILLSLVPGPRHGPLHGYAILQEVAALSDGRLRLSTGTLYTALARLLETGWIEEVPQPAATRGRRAYRLTTTGRTALDDEAQRLSALATLVRARLEAGPA
jgi:DNA-binding PadR family transcriptional regulator